MGLSRRGFLRRAGAALALGGVAQRLGAAGPEADDTLRPLTTDARPIGAAEHAARIAKVQGLMDRRGVAALLVESGTTLEYYTGIRWHRSERTTAALIPVRGDVVVVTPYFEAPSIREMLAVPADVRPWKEDESPFALLGSALQAHIRGGAPLAVEETTRFFVLDRLPHKPRIVPGGPLVDACRMFKSPAELALMQAANDVTLAALRHVHGRVRPGMSSADIAALMEAATTRLGGESEFALVLLNEASAFPHGSRSAQSVRDGSVILIDAGCSVHGYQSDISRTFVHGEPTRRQRELWDTVRHGQQVALDAARPGVACGAIDRAVREDYERRGWTLDYGLPGLSHRTGHGIGMDGHEPPYLVRSDATPLAAGMCFSDEPGLYVPGEFGVRLEDCWTMTGTGPRLFTPLARSLEDPI